MDQQQPHWSPPPQQPAGWSGPGYGGPPPRPTGVTLAAIYLIVMGVLLALAGAACGLFGGAGELIMPSLDAAVWDVLGSVLIFGLVLFVLGILSIAAGAGALGGKGWARWTGVVVSVLFVVLGALSILGLLSSIGTNVNGFAFSLVLTIAYALTAWALISSSSWFAARR